MRRALAEVRERTSGPIIHLPERSDGAAPGAKAQLRQHLVAALGTKHGPSVAALAQECFGAGLTGSANLGFWLLGDRTTVWLDQDAHPRTTRVRDATWAAAPGQGFDAQLEAVRRLDVLDDLSTSPRPDLVVEPVDILHSVDLALDCDPRLWTNRLASVGWPTREDAGYDRVRGEAGPLGPARICTFRSCGHRDYRARLLHELVMSGSLSDEATAACLRGRLPFYEVVERPALGAAVDASKSAFGTAIAFSPELPLRPPLMLSTSLRLIDFSVGALQRFVGDFTTAWSPLTLSHYREDQTNSGRGPLAAYVLNEDLAELVTLILHRVFLDCLDPPDGRLGRCAAQLRTLSERFEPDGSVTLALWASTSASAAKLAARPGAVSQRYAEALRATFLATGLAADRRRFHQEVTQTCRAELARYSGQLVLSGLVQDVPPPAELTDSIPG